MKSHIMKPKFTVFLELNQKHKRGYQVRIVTEDSDNVYNDELFGLADAYGHAEKAIEMINEELGSSYEPQEVIQITGEALEINSKWDVYSSKFINDKEGQYITPVEESGEEIAFTPRGVVLITFFSWRDDRMPKAKEALIRYCEYLARQGYGLSADNTWARLEGMDQDRGASWIEATYSEFVQDDAEAINYVMGKEMF